MGSLDHRREAFRHIYEAYYRQVTAYARRRVDQSDVDDVVAETFLVAWRRMDVIPAGELALAWLYGVARRVISQRQRTGRRRDRLIIRLGGLRRDDVGPAPDHLEDRELVRSALATLREADREILRLSEWEGLSPPELSLVFGCSANAASIRLHGAHKRFASALRSLETRSASLAGEEAPT